MKTASCIKLRLNKHNSSFCSYAKSTFTYCVKRFTGILDGTKTAMVKDDDHQVSSANENTIQVEGRLINQGI